MSVSVKWGRERLSFALPPQNTPVSAIRQSLSEYTQIPKNGFKLIHKGALIADDNAPISAYHIVPNSVIVLLPIDSSLAQQQEQLLQLQQQQQQQLQPTSDEAALLTRIHTELATVRSSLAPELNDLLLRTSSANAPALSPAEAERTRKDFVRLGELLLQSLLRLDAIVPDRDWDRARADRKAAVKEVQALLDYLDDTVAARRAAGL